MTLKPFRHETLPMRQDTKDFVFNEREDFGHKVALFTFDKKKKKRCFPLFYKRVNGELVEVREREFKAL